MSVRSTTIHVVSKAGIFLGILFLVGVLLAAIPAHKLPPAQGSSSEESPAPQQAPGSMPGMDRSDEHAAEAHAVHDMTPGGHDPHNLHMYLTALRPQTLSVMVTPDDRPLPNTTTSFSGSSPM